MKLENRLDVGRCQGHDEGIGRDEASHAHPPVQVHLTCEPPPDLDRLEVASKRLGQRTLHQTLEALLELLESHGPAQTNGPVRPIQAYCRPELPTRRSSRRLPNEWAGSGQGLLLPGRSGEWRNRQTRRIQVPVSERMWGFKSPLAHVKSAAQLGDARFAPDVRHATCCLDAVGALD